MKQQIEYLSQLLMKTLTVSAQASGNIFFAIFHNNYCSQVVKKIKLSASEGEQNNYNNHCNW